MDKCLLGMVSVFECVDKSFSETLPLNLFSGYTTN